MALGTSIFLLAIGAILAFAVTASVAGISIHTVGWILIAVGFIGILLSLIFLGANRRTRVPGEYYDDRL